MHQPRRINFNRYPLKRIVRAKEKHGFVKYECELVGLKTTAWMQKCEFEKQEDFEQLMKFVVHESRMANRPINSRNLIVNRIVGHRYLENGKRVYNIEWSGWEHMCWWEEKTAPELKGAQNLLNAYRKKHGLRQYTEWSDDEESEEEDEEDESEDEEEEEEKEEEVDPMENEDEEDESENKKEKADLMNDDLEDVEDGEDEFEDEEEAETDPSSEEEDYDDDEKENAAQINIDAKN